GAYALRGLAVADPPLRASLLAPLHGDLDRVGGRDRFGQTPPVLVEHATQMLQQEVVLEREPFLAAAHALPLDLPVHLPGIDHTRRRRRLDLERVEVLL